MPVCLAVPVTVTAERQRLKKVYGLREFEYRYNATAQPF